MKTQIPHQVGPLHFVGIGGIGMSGMADIFQMLGYRVQGSDLKENARVGYLRAKGIKIFLNHKADHVSNAGVVIFSDAVSLDNPEITAARKRGIPVVRRVEMLVELLRLQKSIAIAGTHGKTTTTMMTATLLETAGLNPTIINGGVLNAYGTNAKLGRGEWIVAEACEAFGNLQYFRPTIAVVTNIDPEHMEYYKNFKTLVAAFKNFMGTVPFYGFACLCVDHPVVKKLSQELTHNPLVTYGIKDSSAHVRAINLRQGAQGSTFDVVFKHSKKSEIIRDFFIPMAGEHNVQNALVALAIGNKLNLKAPLLKKALRAFKGVERRFTHIGEVRGLTIIDDYGHHPVEIQAVLKTARKLCHGKIWVIFQPHTYTRVKNLLKEFGKSFKLADHVLVAPIYAAREKPIKGITNDCVVREIKKNHHKDVRNLKDPSNIANVLLTEAKPRDMVIFLGAGNVTQWAHALPQQLQKSSPSKKFLPNFFSRIRP